MNNMGEENILLNTFYADFYVLFHVNANANFSSSSCANLQVMNCLV